MTLRRSFVQFIHPGGEHGPDADGLKQWNLREHRRKFLLAEAEYLDSPSGRPMAGPAVFWGEWEPESATEPLRDRRKPGEPRWVHRPYYVRPSVYRREDKVLQNTDPFVFGDHFLYTVCRQFRRTRGVWGPTFLRDLAPGSLILFGSLQRREFVLDTVFVVADSVLHTGADWPKALDGRIDAEYADVTLRPMYEWGSIDDRFRLYFGATSDEPYRDIFSFVPCLPVGQEVRGFPRPAIRLPGMVTPGLMMGAKATRDLSHQELRAAWNAVIEQVAGQGLAFGVRLAMPPRRSPAGAQDAREEGRPVGGDGSGVHR